MIQRKVFSYESVTGYIVNDSSYLKQMELSVKLQLLDA